MVGANKANARAAVSEYVARVCPRRHRRRGEKIVEPLEAHGEEREETDRELSDMCVRMCVCVRVCVCGHGALVVECSSQGPKNVLHPYLIYLFSSSKGISFFLCHASPANGCYLLFPFRPPLTWALPSYRALNWA